MCKDLILDDNFNQHTLHIFYVIVLGWMLMISSQHWFRWWLGAVRQQAIILPIVDQYLRRHMMSVVGNELMKFLKFSNKLILSVLDELND